MATVERFEDLEIWKLASDLANEVFDLYANSEKLSKDFGLRNQMNESSGSIMDNIAEGFERGSKNEFVNFLSYAKGSVGELKSQLYRANSRKYLEKKKLDEFCEKIDTLARKIGKLIGYLNKCIYKGNKFKDRT
jgi:four helix bundle protein